MSPRRIEDFEPADLVPLVRLWRQSFEHGVGIVDPHSLEEQTDYFQQHVRAANRVRVVKSDSLLLGFMASTHESVAQLHVRVGYHRQGIGCQLLDLAKEESGGTLWLYTFARNRNACAFYESQGFSVVQRGFEPTWQLDDVKYAWARA